MSEQVTEVREQERNGRVKASPLARRIARERGIDLAQLRGTGPEGRIVAEDVERAEMAPAEAPAAAPAAPPPGEVEVVPLTSIRKTIARRLTEAWQAPVFQISMSADMSRALALREQLVKLAKDGPKPTISDVLTKIAASALMRHRRLNAEFAGEEVRIHPSANVGMAVATDRGLVVPVIRGAERLSIQEIAAARVDLVDRARGGKLQQADLEGGTFTISNLGMFGVEQFVAVLNPPQVAILAVGAIEEKPVVRDGEIGAPADEPDADLRPQGGRRRGRCRFPPHRPLDARRTRAGALVPLRAMLAPRLSREHQARGLPPTRSKAGQREGEGSGAA